MPGKIGRTLFGGSEQKSQQSSAPVDVTPGEFKRLREPIAQAFEQLFGARSGDPLAGIPQPSGPLVAPLSSGEQQFLDLLASEGGTRRNLLEQTQSGAFLTPDTNPFLQAMIEAAQRPTLQGLEETLTRALPGRFTQAGQFVQPEGSSAFDRAAAIATRGAAQSLGDIATNIAGQAFEAERGRQQESIQLGQQEVQTMVQNLQAQALPRLVEDLGIERGLNEFQNRLQALLQALATASGQTTVFGQESQGTSSGTSQRGVTQGFSDVFTPIKFSS